METKTKEFNTPSLQPNDELDQLRKDLKELKETFFSNNFSAYQEFSKSSNFTTRLKVPYYATLPATCEQGEIAESSGKLNICSATNTWTIVGTQS